MKIISEVASNERLIRGNFTYYFLTFYVYVKKTAATQLIVNNSNVIENTNTADQIVLN